MSNQREVHADMELMIKHCKKLIKSNFEKAIPEMDYKGKKTSIKEEIIYLYALRNHKQFKKNSFDIFLELFDKLKVLKLTKRDVNKLNSEMINHLEEFDSSANILLKSPDDLMLLNHIRLAYLFDKMGYCTSEMMESAVDTALAYLNGLIMKPLYTYGDIYIHCLDDEVARLCSYSVLSWLSDENSKVTKDRNITKLIHKYVGSSLDEMVSKDNENRFGELFIKYKAMCNDEHTDEEREEFWEDKREYILSDFGKLKAEDLLIDNFKNACDYNGELVLSYVRTVDDSFKTCFSKYYSSIMEIEDAKSRRIIYNLIQRYLGDMDELIREEDVYNIRKAIYYAMADSEHAIIREQFNKDLEKSKEQSKLRLNKCKKEIDQLKEQLNFSKDKTNRLMKEIKKLDKDAVIDLENKISELEEINESLKKKQDKHERDKERLTEKIDKLEDTISELRKEKDALDRELRELNSQNLDSEEDESKFNFQSKEIPSNVLYNAIKDKKILLVGGNKIHARIIERGYDNIELLRSGNVNITMHSAQKYDLVVIYTKLVSHSVVERVESELKNSDIPIIRFNQAGINTLLYTIFMYIYGGCDELVGKYNL